MQSFKPSIFSFPKMTGKMGLFIYWGKYSFIHSPTHSLTHSLIHSLVYLFIYLLGTIPVRESGMGLRGAWEIPQTTVQIQSL